MVVLRSTGFSLCTAAGARLKPHRLKPVLLDRAGFALSPPAVRRAGNFHGVFVRNANQEIKFSAGQSEYENKTGLPGVVGKPRWKRSRPVAVWPSCVSRVFRFAHSLRERLSPRSSE